MLYCVILSVKLYFPVYIKLLSNELSNVSGKFCANVLLKKSCRAEVKPLLPMPELYTLSYIDFPKEDRPIIRYLRLVYDSQ